MTKAELLALKWSKLDFERTIIVINDFTYKWLMEQKRRTERIGIESEYAISANSGSPQNYAFVVLRASLGEDKYLILSFAYNPIIALRKKFIHRTSKKNLLFHENIIY